MPFSPIANGDIGAIVTSLEMTERPALDAIPVSELRLERRTNPTPDQYRALYRRVGEPWLWFSRLELDDDALNTVTHDPKICLWAVLDQSDAEVGILELNFREDSQCEIAFFGLVPELAGKGHGKWLMANALNAGWAEPRIVRMWVHTCTLDGPGALGFYIKSGFTPYQRQVETFRDPRLSGLISADAAPQIPLIR